MNPAATVAFLAFVIVVSGLAGALIRDLIVTSRAEVARGRHELVEHATRPARDGDTTAARPSRHRKVERTPEPQQPAAETIPPVTAGDRDEQGPPPAYQPPYKATGSAVVDMDFGDQLAASNAVLRALARNETLPAAANDEPTTLLPPVMSERGGVR